MIELRNISKSFDENEVLSKINIVIKPGEIYGLIGANGSGKSTLMNILNGNEIIVNTGGYTGEIVIDGKIVEINNHMKSVEMGIAMVHQELALFNDMNVHENIKINRENLRFKNLFIPELSPLDVKKDIEDSLTVLRKVDLDTNPKTPLSALSINEKQFIEISRGLENSNIKLLMLDEPTSSLNVNQTKKLLQSVVDIAKSGIAVIFVSHRLEEIMEIADKVSILADGKLISTYERHEFNMGKFAVDMVGREVIKVSGEKRVIEDTPILKYNFKNQKNNITVRKGEILGITGLAGAGQDIFSQGLFNQNSDFFVETTGKAMKSGNAHELVREGIYYLSEDRRHVSILPESPIWKNITAGTIDRNKSFLSAPFLKGLSFLNMKEIKAHTQSMIEDLNVVCSSQEQKVSTLSGGNQQKVCVARALTFNPNLLYVGEPTRGIDIMSKEIILERLLEMNRKLGTTIVVTSGELEELIRISDRICVVYAGEIFKIFEHDMDLEELTLALYGKEKHEEKIS